MTSTGYEGVLINSTDISFLLLRCQRRQGTEKAEVNLVGRCLIAS
jgi:hypothetical protein